MRKKALVSRGAALSLGDGESGYGRPLPCSIASLKWRKRLAISHCSSSGAGKITDCLIKVATRNECSLRMTDRLDMDMNAAMGSAACLEIGNHDRRWVSATVMAEAGANHNGELALPRNWLSPQRRGGADCIKFQTFTAEEFCGRPLKDLHYRSQGKLVTGERIRDVQTTRVLRVRKWRELMSFCIEQDIMFLTTVQVP